MVYDLQQANAKDAYQDSLLVRRQSKLVQIRQRQHQDNHIGDQVDDASDGESQHIVATVASWNGRVPVHRKRSTNETANENCGRDPESEE